MVQLETQLDLTDVKRGFKGMVGRARRGRAFFQELVPSARKDLKEHRKGRRGPAGQWPARSAETRKRARRKSKVKRRKGRTAGLLGKVPVAYKAFFSSDHMRLVNRVKWAGAHNAGARIGNGARLPVREFAYWSRDFRASIRRQYAAFVAKGYLAL